MIANSDQSAVRGRGVGYNSRMMSEPAERRRYARLTLPRPVAARYGNAKTFVMDVSIGGARIAIQQDIPVGTIDRLTFEHYGTPIVFEGEVVRCTLDRDATATSKAIYHAGIRFVRPLGDSPKVLRELISEHVVRALDEQKANARGIPPAAATFQSGVKRPLYLKCRFVGQKWIKTTSTDAGQPLDGFTIAATETPEQIEMLCKTYEDADFNGRKMIREIAQLSIGDEVVPTRRYNP